MKRVWTTWTAVVLISMTVRAADGVPPKLGKAERQKLVAFEKAVEADRKIQRPHIEADVKRLEVEIATLAADSKKLPRLQQELADKRKLLDDHALIVPIIDVEDLRPGFIGQLGPKPSSPSVDVYSRERNRPRTTRREGWRFTGLPQIKVEITLRPDLPDEDRHFEPSRRNCYEITSVTPGKYYRGGTSREHQMRVTQVDPNELWAKVLELRAAQKPKPKEKVKGAGAGK